METLNLESEAQLSSGRRALFGIVALFILIFSIYSNTFYASWKFDDEQNILHNKALHLSELNWQDIKGIFFASPEKKGKIYRPAACFSFALNYYLGKKNVMGYHLVNISIHFFASLFLFLFIYRTLNLPLLKARYGPHSYSIAFLATFLWAINPVQTQAVTYIVQRMASMAGMFYIMAMYYYLKGRTSGKGLWMAVHFFMCLVCGILAVGSKENAAMLPIGIFLFDLFLIQGSTKANVKKNLLIFSIMTMVLLVCALVFYGPSMFDPGHLQSLYEKNRPFTMGERLLTQPRVILFYLSLLFYPMPNRLCISHDIPVSLNLIDPPTTLIAIIAILAILGISIIKSRKWPFISFCSIFFFLNHVIEGSVFPLEICFEHRNYLPSMLLFAPVAILLLKGIQNYSHKKGMQWIVVAFVILVLISLGHSTFVRNFSWLTKESLWVDAVDKAPGLGRPNNNLGRALSLMGMHERAMSEFKTALTKECLHQTVCHAMPYYNLGWECQRIGKLDEALANYKEAVKLMPTHTNTHNNMGTVFAKKNMPEEAENAFRTALSYDNNHFLANKNLGTFFLMHRGRIEEAIPMLDTALKQYPYDPPLVRRLAYAYRVQGQYGKALLLFERDLSLKLYDPKSLLYLSEIYLMRGRHDKAGKLINKFAVSGNISDIGKYVDGVPERDLKLDSIWPYKKMVLELLSKTYSRISSNYDEREKYVMKLLMESQ